MPAFVDLHAHFRDPGFPGKETLESASLAAVAGGYGTVVCMANTQPVIDTPEKAAALQGRSASLGLIDLYPVLSLTTNMEGKELSGITGLPSPSPASRQFRQGSPLMLSEDGKDVADDSLFLAALTEARRLGLPVSCHCDAGGENAATGRAIELGQKAHCRLHIAHVSTREAAAMIRTAKQGIPQSPGAYNDPLPPTGFSLTAEATPHHIALTAADARALGADSLGRVNPALRTEADRLAIIEAILDGTIDAIATDHAPHTEADKERGAPGFTGLETAFAVCRTELVGEGRLTLSRLSSLMSAAPARLLGLGGPGPEGRGRIEAGLRADLVIVDPEAIRTVDPALFKSRGKNSPFIGRQLRGTILMTLHRGRVVFEAP
jgi:dihydroorotase